MFRRLFADSGLQTADRDAGYGMNAAMSALLLVLWSQSRCVAYRIPWLECLMSQQKSTAGVDALGMPTLMRCAHAYSRKHISTLQRTGPTEACES